MAKDLHIRINSHIGLLFDGWGFWPGFTASELEWHLMEMPSPDKVIVHINSPGGDISEGIKIFNRLLDLRKAGTIIEVINEGECYSVVTFIAMAASPGMLKAREASTWCAHKPWMPSTSGTADDLRKDAAELDSFESILVGAYLSRTGKPKEDIEAHLRLDQIISSTEALAQGWIDSIIPNADLASAPAARAKAASAPLAFYRPEPKQSPKAHMTEQEEDSIVTKVVASIKGLFGNGPKNSVEDTTVVAASTTLADESTIYHDGELAVGTAVFTDEALETPVADGSHELSDGRTITVAEGAVTEIDEASTGGEDTAAALASKDQEIADLKAQLETANATASKVTALEAEVKALKNKVPGGGQKPSAPPQNFTGDKPEPEKLTKEKNAFKALAKK